MISRVSHFRLFRRTHSCHPPSSQPLRFSSATLDMGSVLYPARLDLCPNSVTDALRPTEVQVPAPAARTRRTEITPEEAS
ncbi:hypothetical protein EVAR_37555_1 [Eumeta japonica]|uniref:Uncharacterized protein n=1 Tax=Eumeta variegata TaxID=151549 RepID=A0A4C1XSR8_EUMVA|nr:hypothetical protein EVAR_37555_1 [Eumeta japonica]